jgi:inner membrane protein
MPTIMTHAAVPLALGFGLGKDAISRRLLVAGAIASMLPDLDVISFQLGVSSESFLSHRGFTHSLAFAAVFALAAASGYRWLQTRYLSAFCFLFVAMASHGLLDACTDGGRGIAFFWPLSEQRYFFPFNEIRVSPIGVARFLSERGVLVLMSEIKWVWLPCIVVATELIFARLLYSRARRQSPD